MNVWDGLAGALALWIVQGIWSWLRRPRLTLTYENSVPFRRSAYQNNTPIVGTFHRLKVVNSGFVLARGVSGRLVEIRRSSGVPDPSFDPVALHWVGTDPSGLESTARIDLLPGEYQYLDLVKVELDTTTFKAEPFFTVVAQGRLARGITLTHQVSGQTLSVAVAAENATTAGIEFMVPARAASEPWSTRTFSLMTRRTNQFLEAMYPWHNTPLDYSNDELLVEVERQVSRRMRTP